MSVMDLMVAILDVVKATRALITGAGDMTMVGRAVGT